MALFLLNGMHPSSDLLAHRYHRLTDTGVLLFFALLFILPSGYSYGAVVLLLGSLVYCAHHRSVLHSTDFKLSVQDKWVIGVLALFALTASASVLWHANSIKHLDQLSRYILAIPIFLLLLRFPPRTHALWSGVCIGVVLSIGIAVWQLYVLHHERASGYLNIIHFGNIGLVFGLICLAGLRWSSTQTPYVRAWQAALCVGILASIYAVVASGSRGSWVALPPVILIMLYAFASRRSLPYLAGAVAMVAAISVVLYMIPETEVHERFDLAVSEVQRYMNERYVFRDGEVSSVGARLEIWRVALLAIPQALWFGWNEMQFDAYMNHLIAQGMADPYMTQMANTHNNYLEVLLWHGLAGFLPFMLMFCVPLYFFLRRLRSDDPCTQALAVAGACLITSYMMFAISQVILGRNNGVMFFVISLAILWACMRQAERTALQNAQHTR